MSARGPLLALVACALASLAGACGEDERPAEGGPARQVDLALDFTPNPVHAPLFAARRTGADRREGVALRLREPGGSGPDALTSVLSGRALVGILDIHDLAIARERGADVVAVGALVQRPLAALLAQPEVGRPRELSDRTVGVSGLPSDPAFVRAIVERDGGDFAAIRKVTIGFKAVPALVGKRVDAVPAFWNAEGVALRRKGVRLREFRIERYGAPAYPEVVLVTSKRSLERRRGDVKATLRAIASGVEEVERRPEDAVRELARAAGTRDLGLVRAQLDAVRPLFRPVLRLDRGVLERWADYDARIGIVERRPDVARAFAFDVAP